MTIYKVSKIINDKMIVINAGFNQGIMPENKFQIYEDGEDVIDPDTGKSLGKLISVKETVEATTVLENMSICEHVYNSSTSTQLTSSFVNSILSTEKKVLNVDKNEISGGFKSNNPIKIGDKVRPIK